MLHNTMALFINVHNMPLTVAAACTADTDDSRYGSNTHWVTFRNARFENINAKITALCEMTPCILINKYQRL